MVQIFAGVVRGGLLDGGIATVTDVNLSGSIEDFTGRVNAAFALGVNPQRMAVFGPWQSFDSVPDDVNAATSGRGRDPAGTISSYVKDWEKAYFLVRIGPSVAAGGAAAGAGAGACRRCEVGPEYSATLRAVAYAP